MTTYRGAATVITADGSRIPVTADLRTSTDEELTDWSGTLAPAPGADPLVLLSAAQAVLELPGGRSSGFLSTNTNATAAPHGADVEMEVLGSGPVPF